MRTPCLILTFGLLATLAGLGPAEPIGPATSKPPSLSVLAWPAGPGALDLTFDITANGTLPGFEEPSHFFHPGLNTVALQADGRVLAGGNFRRVNGMDRPELARFHPNGALDLSFTPPPDLDYRVYALAVQPDGKVLMGGFRTVYSDRPTVGQGITRLNADGSHDTSFFVGPGVGGSLECLALQPDGRILIGGQFNSFNGTVRNGIARLHPDGALDSGFVPPTVEVQCDNPDDGVNAILLQPDGKILVGGGFLDPSRQGPGLMRLNSNGSLDEGFRTPLEFPSSVFAMALQPDGQVLVGGHLFWDEQGHFGLIRLNSDGTRDDGFTAFAGGIRAIAVLPDGRILAGGYDFNLTLLLPEGTPDPTFHSGPRYVEAIAPQPDGQILVGGTFAEIQGFPILGLARLNAAAPLPPAIEPLPPYLTRLVGQTVRFAVTATGTPPLRYQWFLNGTPFSGATNSVFVIPHASVSDAGAYSVRVENAAGSVTSDAATLTILPAPTGPGSLDRTFNVRLRGHNDWPGQVWALAELPDGRLWIGGWFTQVNDVPRRNLARLHPDGTLDSTCQADVDSSVRCLALQTDGRLLVGGGFTRVNGVPRQGLARLHPDGTVDATFDPAGATSNQVSIGALLLEPEGTIVIGGWFTNLNQSGRSVLARLHPDGQVDTRFEASDILLVDLDHDPISHLVRQPDGKILAGGELCRVDAFPVPGVARFNWDGGYDSTFNPLAAGVHHTVHALALQADAKILLGGWEENTVYRLRPDGALDGDAFHLAEGCHPGPFVLAVQPDAKILLGGDTPDWLSCRLQRLLPDGNVDPLFDPGTGPNDFVSALQLSADGRLWIAGGFTSFNGFPAEGLARLHLGPTAPRTDWAWAQRLGNVQGESCSDLAVDAAGNVYLVGVFLDTLNLGDLTLGSAGSYDAFVAKFNPNGQVVWAQRGGGAEEDTATSVAVDADGYVYVTGRYRGPATFGGISIPATTNHHEFVAKYDASGNALRVYHLDGLPWVSSGGTDLAVDAAGNFYSAGFIHNSQAEPFYTAFVESHTPSGGTQWRRTFAVDYTPWDHRIAVDDQTNVFVSGAFWSNLTIGSLTATNHGQASFFLVKFRQGEPEWLRSVDQSPGALALVDSLSVDPLGNVLVCGHFTHTLTLGTTELTSRGDPDVFLAQYGPDGELLRLQQVGGPGQDVGKAWTNPGGDIFLASRFQGTASLGERVITGDPNHGVFLAELTSLGEPRWVELTGLPEFCRFELAGDGAGGLYLAGNFPGAATFGTNLLVSAGSIDMFLARLEVPSQPPTLLTLLASRTRFAGQTTVLSVSAEGTPPLHYQWFCNGCPLPEATTDTLTLPALETANAGRYSVTVWNLAGSTTSQPATLTILPAPTGPGSVDLSFDLTDNGRVLGMAGDDTGDAYWGYSATVNAIALLPDGRAFVAGDFLGVNGVPNLNYARLRADGSVDPGLDASWGTDGEIVSVAREADGAMLLLGNFSLVNAVPCSNLARLRADGTVDPSFRPTFAFREDWRPMNQVIVQPDGKILICGAFTRVNGSARSSVARLHADGTLDETFNVPVVSAAEHIVLLPDGRILVHGVFPSLSQPVVRLHPNGGHDPTFTLGRPPGTSSFVVFGIAAQPDGKVLVGYGYSDNVARFNADGSYDPSFQPGHWMSGFIGHLLAQPDGKILVGGEFRTLLGPTQYSIARLNADGTLDETFNAGEAAGLPRWWSDYPKVRALGLQPDGRVWVGTQAEGNRGGRYALLRLLPNGARDPGFNPAVNPDHAAPYTMAPLADGKILINGSFAIVNGVRQPGLARLLPDGRLDTSFAPLLEAEYGYVGAVSHLLVQPDDRILISGYFTNINGIGVSTLARLRPNGTLDAEFATQIEHGDVTALALQPDGRILIGGSFEAVAGVRRQNLARLHPDGSLDTSFVPAELVIGDDWFITAIGLQSSGQIVVAGHLVTDPSWSEYYGLTRLNPDGSLDPDFHARVSASGPVFELLLQPDDKIVFSGSFNRVNDVAVTNLARLNADGTLDSTFQPPSLVYPTLLALAPDGKLFISDWPGTLRLNPDGSVDSRWQCDTPGGVTVLANGDVLFGGSFRAVNGVPVYGMARLHGDLEIVPPVARIPITHQTRFAGQEMLLRADACGTGPLSFQWHFNDDPIPGATNAILRLSNLQPDQAGRYTVFVSNAAGSVQSDSATLVVYAPSGPGSLDITLDPTAGGRLLPLASDEAEVSAIVSQPDGKLLVGGYFCGVNGVPRNGIARLHPDGRVDLGFHPFSGVDGQVYAAALQEDGRILIAGHFTTVNGQPRQNIARLEADGCLDTAFNASVELHQPWGAINALAVQNDGRIWVGGLFTNVNGVIQRDLARLHPDGRLDPSFHPAAIPGEPFQTVFCLRIQPDGMILAADYKRQLTRLHPDGSVDSSFNPSIFGHGVHSIALRPDGRMVIAGNFWTVGGQERPGLAQLMPDGSLDSTFVVSVETGTISSVLVQSDGRVLLSRRLYLQQPGPRQPLLRLNPDGGLDSGFLLGEIEEPNSFPAMNALAIQPDGRIWLGSAVSTRTNPTCALVCFNADGSRDPATRLPVVSPGKTYGAHVSSVVPADHGAFLVGGGFTSLNGLRRNGLALLNPDGTLNPAFVPDIQGDLDVAAIARQPDGKWLVGSFPRSGNVPPSHRGLFRLLPDGRYDPSFQFFAAQLDTPVFASKILLQPDGQILASGDFGQSHGSLVRVNPDGSRDSHFAPPLIHPSGDSGVYDMALLPNGQIMISGYWMGETASDGIARLHPDGSEDASFQAGGGLDWDARAILPQGDGSCIVAGDFTTYAGHPVGSVIRLRTDGSLDESFQSQLGNRSIWGAMPQPDGKILLGVVEEGIFRLHPDGRIDPQVHATITLPGTTPWATPKWIQADGRILISGYFTTVNGLPALSLARLNNDLPAPLVHRHILRPLVQLIAAPPAGVSVYAVEDQAHPATAIAQISHGGVFDPATGKVKFGPFYDAAPRTLSYQIVLPPDCTHGLCATYTFAGTASADGLNTPIVGDSVMVVAGLHPADRLAPEWTLSIGEATGYGAAWRRGELWPVPPNPIPIDYVTRAAALWRGGECYTVDPSVTLEPLWWVNCGPPAGADNPSALEPTTNLSSANDVLRQIPPVYVPGDPVTVTILAAPDSSANAYAIEDRIPPGWMVDDISHGGEFDAVNGLVKWGPFFDNTARTLNYVSTPPVTDGGPVRFNGQASFDGASLTIAGPRDLRESWRLQASIPTGQSQIQLILHGKLGACFVIETSTDLQTWTPLATLTNTQGWITFTDPDRNRFSCRFYRAQQRND